MDDLERKLGQLARAPVDPRLDNLEAAVMRGILVERGSGRAGTGTAYLVAFATALLVGITGGLMNEGSVGTRESVAPLGVPSALAPSSLLLDAR